MKDENSVNFVYIIKGILLMKCNSTKISVLLVALAAMGQNKLNAPRMSENWPGVFVIPPVKTNGLLKI